MMPEDFDSSFVCERGQSWNIVLKLSKVLLFCKETGKKIEELLPDSLDEHELIRLSFLGVQHHADAKGIEWDMWIDDHLDGEAYSRARDATAMAIVNFILPKLPENQRTILRHTLKESLATDGDSDNQAK